MLEISANQRAVPKALNRNDLSLLASNRDQKTVEAHQRGVPVHNSDLQVLDLRHPSPGRGALFVQNDLFRRITPYSPGLPSVREKRVRRFRMNAIAHRGALFDCAGNAFRGGGRLGRMLLAKLKGEIGFRISKERSGRAHTEIVGQNGHRFELINSVSSAQLPDILHALKGLRPRLERKSENEWKIIIGQGLFGTVRLARNKLTNEYVAVKKMPVRYGLAEIKKFKLLSTFPDEVTSQVVSLKDYAIVRGKHKSLQAYLFQDLILGGDLSNQHDGARLALPDRPEDRLHLARELLNLVSSLHNHHVYHRDIKPEHILRNEAGNLMLCDLGSLTTELYATDSSGTRYYSAPESKQNNVRSDQEDAFAVGLMCYQLLGLNHPKLDYNAAHRVKPTFLMRLDNRMLAKLPSFIAACEQARFALDSGQYTLHTLAFGLVHPDPEKRLSLIEAQKIAASDAMRLA